MHLEIADYLRRFFFFLARRTEILVQDLPVVGAAVLAATGMEEHCTQHTRAEMTETFRCAAAAHHICHILFD